MNGKIGISDESIGRQKQVVNLKYLIDKECFITSNLLDCDRFVSYCRNRGIDTSREQLERFEKLGLFYPFARVKHFWYKVKIEKLEGNRERELGVLQEEEEWDGHVEERQAYFSFAKKIAHEYLEEGLLWEPLSRPFQAWEEFKGEYGIKLVESFYSIFQCHTLYLLNYQTKYTIRLESWPSNDKRSIQEQIESINQWAEKIIPDLRKRGVWASSAPLICQIIANRYFPITQSDRRTIRLSIPVDYHNEWNWYKYRRIWNAQSVLADIGITIEELREVQERVAIDAKTVDPLEDWYDIVNFVALQQKERLKDKALLAQTFYSMEHMLRLFYQDLTGQRIHAPDESYSWDKDRFYGEGVTKNQLLYLEFLTNKYHLNPKPNLILVVEGNGEEQHLPYLTEGLLGVSFSCLGIEVMNLKGIGNFEGSKTYDKCSALARFIDYFHDRQTLVFLVLDKENRAGRVAERLKNARSRYHPERTITKEEHVYLWNRNIEFDNFTHVEIAQALTELSGRTGNRYEFKPEEVNACQIAYDSRKQDPLNHLFMEKCNGYALSKPDLLEILFGYILSSPQDEFNGEEAKRPLVKVILKIRHLASRNYQPINLDFWKRNQESGYFGDPVK